jgi:HD-GYP domain-containing protein (c-di-GMP phosphodiesterase class II)
MDAKSRTNRVSVVAEIKKKTRLLNAIVGFVIVTLFILIAGYLFKDVLSFTEYLPAISITVTVGIVFFLSVLGLYISIILSRKTVRIITDYSSRLERILEITSDLRDEVHSDILLNKIMDYALSITRSEAGSLLLADKDNGDKLTFKIVSGEKASDLIGTSVEKGKGITGMVFQTGEPVRIHEAYKNKLFNPEVDEKTGFKTYSLLCVPLKTKQGVIGVLELLNKMNKHPYRQRDEEIIIYLAEQAAMAIIKTRFVEDQRNYEIHHTEILLEAIDIQVPEKKGHARRVAKYSNMIAKGLNMTEEEQKRLYFACLLHDVGFLKIRSEEIFRKEEFKKHPVIGHEMIKPINFYADIAPFVLHHHERYDGYGYPSQLKGEDIPLEARIIAIAEAFDSMVGRPTYRVPVSFNEAKEELQRNSGSQFDPELTEIFLENIAPEHIK